MLLALILCMAAVAVVATESAPKAATVTGVAVVAVVHRTARAPEPTAVVIVPMAVAVVVEVLTVPPAAQAEPVCLVGLDQRAPQAVQPVQQEPCQRADRVVQKPADLVLVAVVECDLPGGYNPITVIWVQGLNSFWAKYS